MKNKPDVTRFSLHEAFNSPNGKTSISLICGFLIVITGCLGFSTSGIIYLTMTMIVKTRDITIVNSLQNLILQSVAVITIGVTLLGIRRFTPDKKLLDSEQ